MRNLRQLREARGWSQLDLALRLGVSQNAVSNWERGVAVPSEANWRRLALLFAVTPPSDMPETAPSPPPDEHYGGGDMAGVG